MPSTALTSAAQRSRCNSNLRSHSVNGLQGNKPVLCNFYGRDYRKTGCTRQDVRNVPLAGTRGRLTFPFATEFIAQPSAGATLVRLYLCWPSRQCERRLPRTSSAQNVRCPCDDLLSGSSGLRRGARRPSSAGINRSRTSGALLCQL
jgi:hypothetical protein